jgi:glycine/D-amino acid oxidase-like deaminating enzyme
VPLYDADQGHFTVQFTDGLASIGPSPEWAHAYFALGYGGYGITMSMIAAELIPDHYLGQHHPDAELFRFAR